MFKEVEATIKQFAILQNESKRKNIRGKNKT